MRVSIFITISALASGIVSQPLARRSDGGYSARAHGHGGPGGPGGPGFGSGGPGPSGHGAGDDSDDEDPMDVIDRLRGGGGNLRSEIIKQSTIMAPKQTSRGGVFSWNSVKSNTKLVQKSSSSHRYGRY